MSCSYYKYSHGYYCVAAQKNIDSDIYRRFCSTYSYGNCPIYKDANKSSTGCYLTTACVESRGLPDDCHELTAMRALRDKYIRTLPEGESVIAEYYEFAPAIVEKINQGTEPEPVYERIYTEMILPCVQLYDAGDYHKAYVLYREYAGKLKSEYLGT